MHISVLIANRLEHLGLPAVGQGVARLEAFAQSPKVPRGAGGVGEEEEVHAADGLTICSDVEISSLGDGHWLLMCVVGDHYRW